MRLISMVLLALATLLSGCSVMSPSSRPAQQEGPGSEEVLLPGSQTSPAVMDLLTRARQAAAQGDIPKAESLLERSVRIEPRNATLWNYLAKLKLEQGRTQEAQGLAAKSTALAANNNRLVADNWRIIAHALYQSGDIAGARKAEARAREILATSD
jgi:tetratricopeptide (TPR) repeat protein